MASDRPPKEKDKNLNPLNGGGFSTFCIIQQWSKMEIDQHQALKTFYLTSDFFFSNSNNLICFLLDITKGIWSH